MELRITRLTTLWPSIHHFQVILLFYTSLLCLQPPTDCLRNLGNETDRLALLEFKSKIGNDPHDVFSSWNDSVNFCKWQGITCGRKHHRVTSLNLYGLSLSGTISPFIGNLTFLRFLNLRNNSFHGEIPQEVGRLSRLRHLNLTDNRLGGEIPLNITYCSELRILILARNRFVGKILDELGSLKKLVSLDLYGNNLTGEIPHSFGNLSSFKHLSVAVNNLAGNIPNKLGQLTGLTFFSVGVNNLIGTIPVALYNISSINVLSVPDNQLKGSLPANIGLTLRNLQDFYIGGNQFYGTIPSSFTNASLLEIFDISGNFFTGQVPKNFGDLRDLQQVNFEFNFLGSDTSKDLSFITSLSNCSNLEILSFAKNNFGGVLPAALANLSTKLSLLGAGGNRISGRLPSEVGNLVNLYALGLEENHFSGTIPISFGKLRKLQKLYLHTNLLSGQIPPSLGNLSQLYELHLGENKLQGNITSSIANCQNLQALDISNNFLIGFIPPEIIGLSSLSTILNLSHNTLTGPLPQEIHKLKNINALDVSQNKLYGEIPETIGDCLMLENLNMQGNFLQGSIPSTLASLRGLQHLDLSRNNLSGNIPKELQKLPFLIYVNLSFNNLEVEVRRYGVFSNTTAVSLVGNKNLCGDIPYRGSLDLHGERIVLCEGTQPSSTWSIQKLHSLSASIAEHRAPNRHVYNKNGIARVCLAEYGIGGEPTTYGDVYSFGIILLEIITGRRPIDEVITYFLNLKNYVRTKLPGQVIQVLDHKLIATGDVGAEEIVEDNESDDGQTEIQECNFKIENLRLEGCDVQKWIVSVLKIGLACSVELPGDRMNMTDVTRKLNIITEAFLRARTHTERQIPKDYFDHLDIAEE
ncbi:LRR receptor-like serine/threonine-protein kinase EFR [Hevea brasiliensis]|nr:LRR receptor-like serine/threonine-protein kinase EFR [Hevea brasiliensis]